MEGCRVLGVFLEHGNAGVIARGLDRESQQAPSLQVSQIRSIVALDEGT